MTAVGKGGKGTEEGRGGGAGTCNDLQGGGSDGVSVWERDLGDDRINVDGYRWF